MSQSFNVFFYGIFAGVTGTAVGCLLGYILLKVGQKSRYRPGEHEKNLFYAMLYEFSSGLMMAIVTFHLLPEAIDIGGLTVTMAGLASGLLFLLLTGKLLKNKQGGQATGFFLLIGIMLHNIPEGMAIGTAMVNHISLAVSLLWVITLHDIPEGITAYFALQPMKLSWMLLLVLLCGIPTGFSALFGSLAGGISPGMNAMSLGFAAGAMLYILVWELSREAKRLSQRKLAESVYIVGLILGILLK